MDTSWVPNSLAVPSFWPPTVLGSVTAEKSSWIWEARPGAGFTEWGRGDGSGTLAGDLFLLLLQRPQPPCLPKSVSTSPHSSPSILLWPRASGLTPSKSQNANHLGSFRMLTPKPHFQTSSLNWSELNSSIDILKSSPGTFNLQAGCRTTAFRCSNPGPTPPALVLVFSMMPAENNDTNNNDTCHYYSQQEPTISEHLLYVRQCSNSFTGMNTLNSHFWWSFRWKKLSHRERFKNLPKISQLVSEQATLWIQEEWLQHLLSLSFFTFIFQLKLMFDIICISFRCTA